MVLILTQPRQVLVSDLTEEVLSTALSSSPSLSIHPPSLVYNNSVYKEHVSAPNTVSYTFCNCTVYMCRVLCTCWLFCVPHDGPCCCIKIFHVKLVQNHPKVDYFPGTPHPEVFFPFLPQLFANDCKSLLMKECHHMFYILIVI